MAESTDLSPLEWLGWLGPKLVERQEAIGYYRRYYEGDHDLPTGPQQHLEAYRRFQRLARTNLCGLCAESMVHRMQAIGYRDSSGDADEPDDGLGPVAGRETGRPPVRIWRKAFSRSAAYVIVGVDPRKPANPRVTIEGPENVIVETDPATPPPGSPRCGCGTTPSARSGWPPCTCPVSGTTGRRWPNTRTTTNPMRGSKFDPKQWEMPATDPAGPRRRCPWCRSKTATKGRPPGPRSRPVSTSRTAST